MMYQIIRIIFLLSIIILGNTEFTPENCFHFFNLILFLDYVDSLKKPIRSKYSQGLFVQYPSKNGIVYNVRY